jgi:DNA replicative helicase MCM subunit Mcm2 (Cdc46/Mcm family)
LVGSAIPGDVVVVSGIVKLTVEENSTSEAFLR